MAELYTDLDNLANEGKEWKCKLLFNQAVFNQGEEVAEDVNIVDLCEFLPFISVRDRKEKQDYPPGTNYMFPERFMGLAGKGLLLVELKLAAIQCGYSLAIRSSKVVSMAESDRAFSCTLTCLHGKVYSKNSTHQKSTVASEKDGASNMSSKTSSSKNKTKTKNKAKYRTSTKRPTDKQFLCPFKIKLFLQKESADRWPGQWFLSGETGNCCHHDFHSEHEPGHMHVPIQLMTEEEKKLAKDCSQLYFTASSSANDSDSDSSTHDMDISESTSHRARNILGQDILGQDVLATQQSQSDDVQVLTQSSDHKYQVANGKLQSLLKLIEDDDAEYQTLLDALDKMTMDKVAGMKAPTAQKDWT
jgi:hypothetical protein